MKEYSYNGIRYKRDNNGQWQYYHPDYKTWIYTQYNNPSVNGTPVYESGELERLFKAKDPYLKETTTQKVEQEAAANKKAQDRVNTINNPLLSTQQKINHFSKNAPTVENANTVKELQAQKKVEDEKARKAAELEKQELDRQELLRNVGSDNTRVNLNKDAYTKIPTMQEQMQAWETFTKNQKDMANRIVMRGDAAKYYPEIRDYYLSRENSHRPGGPLSMEEIVLERMRKNPNFLQDLEERKYKDFQKREQQTWDEMPWYMKGINTINALATDPITTLERGILEFERPLAFQGLESTDPESFGEDARFYDRALHRDENTVNNLLNYVNPFRAASSLGQNLSQGDYSDAAIDAVSIIPMIKGAKAGWKGMNALMKVNPTKLAGYANSNLIGNASPLVQSISNKATVGNLLTGYGGYEAAVNNFPNAFDAYASGDWKTGNKELFTGILGATPLAMEMKASKVIPRTVNALRNTKSTALPVMGETAEFAPAMMASEADDAASIVNIGSDNARYEYKFLPTADEVAKLKSENPNITTQKVFNENTVYPREISIYNEGKLGQVEAFDDSGDFAINWGVKDIDKYNQMVANSSEIDMLKLKIARINSSPTNQEIMKKASDINKVIYDEFELANNIKSYDDWANIDMNEFYKFQNQKISEFAAQDPEVITILRNNENIWNQRQALINKKETISQKLAESAEEAIDPRFKEKVIQLYKEAGVPEDKIPKSAFEDSGSVIRDFGKDRAKLVDMDYRDPLSEPSFAALSDADQMKLANDWQGIGGVRTGDATITLGSKVHEPLYHTAQRRDWKPVITRLEEPREYTPWKPWTWKNKGFEPRTRIDYEPFYHGEPVLVETTNKNIYGAEHVGGVNVHEFGHDYQKFYNNWGSLLGDYDPAVGYWTTSNKNPLAQRFQKAMVEAKPVDPVTGKRVAGTWDSAPIELHSELMRARYEFYTQMKAAKPELSQQQIINWIKNAEETNDASLFDFYNQQLKSHFKETTPMTERRDLIKLLPVAIPAVGYGILEGMKNANESETPQNKYGGNIEKLSKFIRK